jgi:hypothetical protein
MQLLMYWSDHAYSSCYASKLDPLQSSPSLWKIEIIIACGSTKLFKGREGSAKLSVFFKI